MRRCLCSECTYKRVLRESAIGDGDSTGAPGYSSVSAFDQSCSLEAEQLSCLSLVATRLSETLEDEGSSNEETSVLKLTPSSE
jgi:hypothetical protein